MANKNDLSQEQRVQRGNDKTDSANDFFLDEVPVERHDVVMPESSLISDEEVLLARSDTQGDDYSIEGRAAAGAVSEDSNPLEGQEGAAVSTGDSNEGSPENSSGTATRAFQSKQTEAPEEKSSPIQFTDQGNSRNAGLSQRAESTSGESRSQPQGSVTATPDDGGDTSQPQPPEGEPAPVINLGPTDIEYVGGSIAENAAAGSVVANLSAVDPDDVDGFVFEITDDPSGNFEVVGNEIRVKMGASLDAETAQSHSITVEVTDSGGNTYSEVLTFNVSDVNEDGVGAVSDADASANALDETAGSGTVVGVTAVATDPDGGDSVTYSLSSNPGGLFAIDANTGVVTLTGSLDVESAQSHLIEVTATSSDGSTSAQSFTIAVNDVDEFNISATSDSDGSANSVLEFAAVGTAVGVTALASDADATDTVTYSLSSNPGGFFAIDAQTGVVTVANALDYESATDHIIEVTSTSADGSTSTQNFTIDVTDADEFNVGAVSDTNASANAVNENASIGATVGITASASDGDGSDTVTYSLSSNPGGLFAIDAQTGVVTVAGAIDREAAASYDIEVTATSSDGSTSAQSYTIQVNDIDEFDVGAVSDTDASANTVAENAGIGASVGIDVTASDGDATSSTVTYSLSDDAGGLFTIDADTGAVTVAGALDYETSTSHSIEVTATSADGSTSTQTFNIGVSDVNEAPTDLTFTGNAQLEPDSNSLSLNSGSETDQYVSATNFTGFPSSKITVEMSMTSTHMPQSGGGATLISYAEGSDPNEFTIIARADGTLSIYIEDTRLDTSALSTNLFDGTQHRLSVSWDSTDGSVKVYVDGTQEYSTTGFKTGATIESGGTLIFGQDQDSVGGGFASNQIFRGDMEDVRIFNDVRTAQEITDNANGTIANPSSEQGLVSNWQMNTSGGTITDEAGNNNFTLNGGASVQSGDTITAGNVVASAASVVDPDSGDTFTYSLTDNAGGMYQIDASTGAISLVSDHSISSANSDTVTVQVTDSGGNTYSETIGINLGTSGTDTLNGTANTDVMYGFGGNDTLNGGGGDDILYGGDEALASSIQFTQQTGGSNPFNGIDVGSDSAPAFVDIDGDGDLDMFVGNGGSYGGDFEYFENTGTASNPVYSTSPTENPFGLSDAGGSSTPTFVDIDGDGDLDAFAGYSDGKVHFFENTGNSTNPSFASSTTNPFGLTDVGSYAAPIFVDIDGDLDAFVGNGGSYGGDFEYFENTGTASNPVFSWTAENPFGLSDLGSNANPTFIDADGDGDLDIFAGYSDGSVRYFENTGDSSNPSFASASTNPFGIIDIGSDATPTFADIDGDGDLDLIVGESNGTINYFENTTIAPGGDTLNGGDGNDILVGGGGADSLNGGAGTDTASYEGSSAGVTVNLAANSATGGDAEGDTFNSIENLTGSSHNDTLTGDANANTFDGGAGNDTLSGGGGSDIFIFQMGDGADTVNGGAGGGWTDTIQLSDASGGSNLGTYGVDWTVTLSEGTINDQDANGLDLSGDADGVITLTDGSTVNFFDIERIDF